MTADDLIDLARSFVAPAGCAACSSLVCPGWESLPGDFFRSQLRVVGTLRDPANEDPTLAEYHPHGTHGWSADAPIATEWFPYNRCDVWKCVA